MHKHKYDLERFGPRRWDDHDENEVANIPPDAFASEEAEHILNVAIACWIEDLCAHEVGQDWLFAPNHLYASFHQDLPDQPGREQEWLVLFYETALFEADVGKHTEASLGLQILRSLDPKGDIVVQSVFLTSLEPLNEQAEEVIYRRIVQAAQAHASGSSSIMSLDDALDLATSSVH